MTIQLSEEKLWAAEAAPRLRLLQASCVDEPADVRQRYLIEELDRLIKPVPVTKRNKHLEALAVRFPAWEASSAASPAFAEQTPAKDLPVEELVEKLARKVSTLSDAQRKAFGQLLREAGLELGGAGGSMEVAVPAPLSELLAGQSLDLERALRTLAQLIQSMVALEKLSKGVWNDVAGDKKQIKNYQEVLGRYLAGNPQVTEQQAIQLVEETRKTIASLLGAMKWGPKQFSTQHFEIFDPVVIQANIKPGPFQSRDALSWERYESLFQEYYPTKESLEKGIRDAVGTWAKNLLAGGGTPPGR